jgi:voltage-gated potassium channel
VSHPPIDSPTASLDEADASRRHPFGEPPGGWRGALYKVVFESDTRAGVLFDKVLVALIVTSLLVVIADSVESLQKQWSGTFTALEWGFTLLFSLEYVIRLLCVRKPLRYATSFFGIVDLIAVLPTYLALLFPEIHALIDVRVLRLLRVFRIFKLTAYVAEYQALGSALLASSRKIMVFLSVVIMIVIVMGSIMYVVEGPANGYTSIPVAIYWAITTMTTVGFGDITPKTELGRFIASIMMLLGWGTLAVPTGIVTTEMTLRRYRQEVAGNVAAAPPPAGLPGTRHACAACGSRDHGPAATYCQHCGAALG